MTIDELVDKVLAKHKHEQDELRDESQQPFRYITNAEELQQELESEKPDPVSIMQLSEDKSIFEIEQVIFTLAMGDIDTIESVLKKHQDVRKNKLE